MTTLNPKARCFSRNVTCFCCQGEIGPNDDLNFDSNYCANGELDIVLKPDYHCERRTCEAFGVTISVSTAFTSLADTLRNLCVRSFFVLEKSTEFRTESFHSGYNDHQSSYQFTQIRTEICKVLNFLKKNAKILLRDDSALNSSDSILKPYLTNLKIWALSFGRISDIPLHTLNVILSKHQNTSACHLLFHVKLDFWWFLLVVYHSLDSPKILQNVSSDLKVCLASQVPLRNRFVGELIFFVLWDLVTLASLKFQKLHISDYMKVSPFHCSCITEFWFLLLHLLNHRQQNNNDDYMWMHLNYILNNVTSEGSQSHPEIDGDSCRDNFRPKSFECRKPVEFSLWLLTGVANVWKYDPKGRFNKNAKGMSNYYQLQKLVTGILTELEDGSRNFDESKLQYCLQVCLTLGETWEPNLDLLITFTDYFIKNLNTCNRSGKTGIAAHCFPETTGHQWIEQIKDLVSRAGTWTCSDNSFQLFILYVCQQLQHVQRDKLVNSWRKVASRIFLKLNRLVLQELLESGLYNLLTLLLSLSCISNSKDICNKLITMSSKVSGFPTKRLLFWRALFALAHNYQQNNEDIYLLTKALSDQFHETIQLYLRPGNDHSSRQMLQKVIVLYLNEAQDIFDCSHDLALSEHLLIGESFALLLPNCSTSELSTALFTVEQALVQFRNIREKMSKTSTDCYQLMETDPRIIEKHQAFVDQLFQFVVPFVETHATTQTPPDSIANIAAGLALLSSEGFHSLRIEDVRYFINRFALSAEVNSKISSIFLCHTIVESKIVDGMNATEQIQILGVWLRGAANTLCQSLQIQDLGKLVSKLPEVLRVFPSLQISLAEESNHVDALIHFFKCHSEMYHRSSNNQEKFLLSDQFQEALRPFVTEIKKLLKGNSNQEMVKHIFKLTGHLVYYCSPVLYTVGSPSSLLPVVLATTVLHTSLVRDKIPNQTLLSVCKEYLHLFILGLVQLNFQTDAFVNRKLRDIIVVYLPKFPVAPGKVCPLLNFKPSDFITQEKTDEALLFFTNVICDSFLKKSSEPNSNTSISMAILFVSEVLRRTSALNKSRISTMLFPSVLELLFHAQDRTLSTHVVSLLTALLSSANEDEDLRVCVIGKLQAFVEQHLPWQSRHVFSLLERMAVINNSLVLDFLPSLTSMVKTVEEKRGVGLDKSLRQGLMNVTRHLEKK